MSGSNGNERRRHTNRWLGSDIVTRPHRQLAASVAGDAEKRPCLTVLRGAMPGRLFELPQGKFLLGRGNDCGVQVDDPSVSRHHLLLERRGAVVTERDNRSTNGTRCNGEPLTEAVLSDGDKLEVGPDLVLRFNLKDRVDEAFQRSQFEALTSDALTGCHNRRFFDSELAREVIMARSTGLPMTVAMIDLDRFKAVNDTWGHGVGDGLLRDVGRIIRATLRSYDIVARYGGEEFAIVMRATDLKTARACIERVRHQISAQPFVLGRTPLRLTVSRPSAGLKGD